MSDPTSITAAFASVKTALEIAKLLREGGQSLQKAEFSNRLADLMSSLADAKMALVDGQDALSVRDARIAELEEAFNRKDDVRRVNDGMYRFGPNGGIIGEPFCLRCWEADHRLRPLAQAAKNYRHNECHFCHALFADSMTGTFKQEVPVDQG